MRTARHALIALTLLLPLLAAAPADARCTTNADCRAYSSNCESCACLALETSAPEPFCRGNLVSCLPEACSGQQAVCNTATGECQIACRPDKVCGTECCPLGSECIAGTCLLPDIYPDGSRAGPRIAERSFSANACELDPIEGPCIDAPGNRRLLRFSTDTPNIGDGDLFFGSPSNYPELYEFSPCHNHYHFSSYARYELFDQGKRLVADGGKRAFCLEDLRRINGPQNARFTCGYQGIQRGWADVYSSSLSCQWIDITCVPEGQYNLVLSLNFAGKIAELDYSNNQTTVPVTITAPTCQDDNDCKLQPVTCGGKCWCGAVKAECNAPLPCNRSIRGCENPCKGRTPYCGSNGRCAVR